MGVYIDLEMPKNKPLIIKVNPDGTVNSTVGNGYRMYKAVPVPPHGRLIDADALEKDIDKYIGGEETRSRFHHFVQVQRTVIPDDEGEHI